MSTLIDSNSDEIIKGDIPSIDFKECPVCYSNIDNDVYCRNKHIICAECYLKIRNLSLERDEFPKCPQCRVEMANQFEYRF